MLVGLHGVLNLVGLVENHRGHQDDHRDGEPGSEAQASDGRHEHDGEGSEAAEDDGDLQEGEVEVGHEHQGGEARDHAAGDDAGRDEHAAGVTLGGKDDVADEGDENEGFQNHVETQTSILGTTGGAIEGQGLGHGGRAPESQHDKKDAPAAEGLHHGAEPGEKRESDARLLVEPDEEEREQGRKGGEADGHEAVGATEERGAIGSRGVSDDKGIRFHTLHLSPFPRQSSPPHPSPVTKPHRNYPEPAAEVACRMFFGHSLND